MERRMDGMDDQNIFRRIDPANRPIQLIMGLGLAQICVFLFAEHRESRADPENKAIQLAAAVCLLACAPLAPHVYQAEWRGINWPFVVLVIGLSRFFYKPYSRLSPVFYGGILVAVLALISVNAYFQGPLLRTVDLMTLGLGLAQLGVFLFSRRKREAV